MSFDPRVHKFANNAESQLAADITAGATSITVTPGSGARFPTLATNQIFKVTLYNPATGQREILHCTARSTDTMTVERAQESTTAAAFPAGSLVIHAITAGTLEWLESLA